MKHLVMAVALTTAVATSPAHAYLPPSFYIVRQIARKHADLKGTVIKSRVTFYDGSTPKAAPLQETLAFGESGRVGVTLKSSEGQTLGSVTRTFDDNAGSQPILYGLSLLTNGAWVYSQLKSAGFPLKTEAQLYADKNPDMPALPYNPESTVGVGRGAGRIVLILGNNPKPTGDSPQLWVDKGSFLPVRAFLRTESGEPLELRMDQHSIHGSSFYPKTIEVHRSGRLWAKMELLEIRASDGPLGGGGNRVSPDAGPLAGDLEAYMKWLR